MTVVPPTYVELVNNAWQAVSTSVGLTNNSESGIAYAIVKIVCAYILDLWNELAFIESQGDLSTATGTALDRIGSFLGVPRLQSTVATTLGATQSVYFTNNGQIQVTIPAGTRVWNPSDINRAFFTTSTIIVPAGSIAYVDVIAANPGSFYNTAANTLIVSNLGNPSVTVNNILPINSGNDTESDNNYRVRISQYIATKEGPNLVAIQQTLLAVPGVRDVLIQNLARGTGTFDVLVLSYDKVIPQSIIDQAQSVLDDMVAVGVSAIAKAPIPHFVDVIIRLTIRPNGDIAGAQAAAILAAHGLVDNLPIEDGSGNGTLLYDQLTARIELSHPDITDSQVTLTVDDSPSLKSDQQTEPGNYFTSRSISTL